MTPLPVIPGLEIFFELRYYIYMTMTIDMPQVNLSPVGYKYMLTDVKRLVATKLYLNQTVGIAEAADIAGMGRVDFEQYLGSHEIPISLLTYEDVQNDLAKIRKLRKAGRLPSVRA
jgi:predicted HTH domain antitoxin